MTKRLISLVVFSLTISIGFSQEKTKKELRMEAQMEKQKQIETMVNAKDFIFIARTALPSGMKNVDLFSNPNFVKFQPEYIESDMPFFGKAYSTAGYGSDTGLKFQGKPEKYSITKGKKNYQINATVRAKSDNFQLSLLVGFEGSTSLTISSNNRSSITYQGEISAPEKQDKNNK